MNETTPIDLVSAALVAAQGELEPATFDSKNPFLNNRYASLGAIIHQSRPVLAKHGLAILQVPTTNNGEVAVTTTIIHKSGQTLNGGTIALPIGDEKGKSRAQVAGSIVTYLRRYSWSAVLGIYAEEDTDGNAPPTPKPTSTPRQQPKPTPPKEEPKAPATPEIVTTGPNGERLVIGPKYRLQILNRLQAAPGGKQRPLVHQYLTYKQWIKPDQEPEEWVLDHLPKTAEEFAKLGEAIKAYERETLEGRSVEVPVP